MSTVNPVCFSCGAQCVDQGYKISGLLTATQLKDWMHEKFSLKPVDHNSVACGICIKNAVKNSAQPSSDALLRELLTQPHPPDTSSCHKRRSCPVLPRPTPYLRYLNNQEKALQSPSQPAPIQPLVSPAEERPATPSAQEPPTFVQQPPDTTPTTSCAFCKTENISIDEFSLRAHLTFVQCDKCRKIFDCQGLLKEHAVDCHIPKDTCPTPSFVLQPAANPLPFPLFTPGNSQDHPPSEKLPVPCYLCNAMFADIDVLLKHRVDSKCDGCQKPFRCQGLLALHQEEDLKRCPHCNTKIHSGSEAVLHKELNQCTDCLMTFPCQTFLDAHFRRHCGPLGKALAFIQCGECTTRFESVSDIISHMENTECSMCGVEFSCNTSLKTHFANFECAKTEQVACDKCSAKFCHPLVLKLHKATCGQDFKNSINCQYCGLCFKTSQQLKGHYQPDQCSSCLEFVYCSVLNSVHLLTECPKTPKRQTAPSSGGPAPLLIAGSLVAYHTFFPGKATRSKKFAAGQIAFWQTIAQHAVKQDVSAPAPNSGSASELMQIVPAGEGASWEAGLGIIDAHSLVKSEQDDVGEDVEYLGEVVSTVLVDFEFSK